MRNENEVSTDSVLQDALILLDEVSSYLKRLPAVPITLQLARKVDAFTADPFRKTAIRIAKESASEQEMRSQTRSAATFTPAGLPVIQVEVKGKEQTLTLSDLEGSFEDVINTLQKWKTYFESGCEDGEVCKLDINYYGFVGSSELTVKYYRQETDEEFKVRLEKAQRRLIKQQERDLEQLKKLQEKYKEINIEL